MAGGRSNPALRCRWCPAWEPFAPKKCSTDLLVPQSGADERHERRSRLSSQDLWRTPHGEGVSAKGPRPVFLDVSSIKSVPLPLFSLCSEALGFCCWEDSQSTTLPPLSTLCAARSISAVPCWAVVFVESCGRSFGRSPTGHNWPNNTSERQGVSGPTASKNTSQTDTDAQADPAGQ